MNEGAGQKIVILVCTVLSVAFTIWGAMVYRLTSGLDDLNQLIATGQLPVARVRLDSHESRIARLERLVDRILEARQTEGRESSLYAESHTSDASPLFLPVPIPLPQPASPDPRFVIWQWQDERHYLPPGITQ